MGGDEISRLDQLSTSRIKDAYRWEDIITKYEEVFLEGFRTINNNNNEVKSFVFGERNT